MAKNVCLMPGLFGSKLFVGPPSFPVDTLVWVSPFAVISGIVIQLQLAADGFSPGRNTFGFPVFQNGILDEFYEPLARFIEQQGCTVLRGAYDWRLDLDRQANEIVRACLARFVNEPFVFVAHSLGGLVARRAATLLKGQGRSDQVLGIVTIGTPHFGSLAPVQTWFGAAEFYQRLAQGAGLFFPGGTPPRLTILDLICATWPSMYMLQSFRNSGPLFANNPAAAASLYVPSNYAGGNPFLQSATLESAISFQDSLTQSVDAGSLMCIVGDGVRTVDNLDTSRPLNSPITYLYSDNGDGIVPVLSAQVPGAQVLTVSGVQHELLPQSGACWGAVRFFLNQTLGLG